MERELKDIKYLELPESFEDNVLERIRKIKRRRKRTKVLAFPALLLAILALTVFIFYSTQKKEYAEGKNLTFPDRKEQISENEIFLEVIPVKNFERENIYLIETIKDNEEKIYAF
jgi:cbb3-type cytochrome oxidase subunit 3